jgi:soluble lytic murein transglycosylase-like protein
MLIRRLLGSTLLAVTLACAFMLSPMRPARAFVPKAAPTIETHIKEAAQRYEVSERLVVAVIEVESQFNPRAVSHKGAQGLMQLMPATAASLGVRDAFDPRENIHGGVKHLRWLMERFDNDVPRVLVAYNAGERVVIKNRPVPRETREYVKRVMERMQREERS